MLLPSTPPTIHYQFNMYLPPTPTNIHLYFIFHIYPHFIRNATDLPEPHLTINIDPSLLATYTRISHSVATVPLTQHTSAFHNQRPSILTFHYTNASLPTCTCILHSISTCALLTSYHRTSPINVHRQLCFTFNNPKVLTLPTNVDPFKVALLISPLPTVPP